MKPASRAAPPRRDTALLRARGRQPGGRAGRPRGGQRGQQSEAIERLGQASELRRTCDRPTPAEHDRRCRPPPQRGRAPGPTATGSARRAAGRPRRASRMQVREAAQEIARSTTAHSQVRPHECDAEPRGPPEHPSARRALRAGRRSAVSTATSVAAIAITPHRIAVITHCPVQRKTSSADGSDERHHFDGQHHRCCGSAPASE